MNIVSLPVVNPTTAVQNNNKNTVQHQPKANNLAPLAKDTVSFKAFPLLREGEGMFWKITGQDILNASKKELRKIAEHMHKQESIPEDVYKVEKENFFGFTKTDEFKTGSAYQRLSDEIEAVKESRKTASSAELRRLDKMAETCEDELMEKRSYTYSAGVV